MYVCTWTQRHKQILKHLSFMICWYSALWLVKNSHVTCNIQSECFISTQYVNICLRHWLLVVFRIDKLELTGFEVTGPTSFNYGTLHRHRHPTFSPLTHTFSHKRTYMVQLLGKSPTAFRTSQTSLEWEKFWFKPPTVVWNLFVWLFFSLGNWFKDPNRFSKKRSAKIGNNQLEHFCII